MQQGEMHKLLQPVRGKRFHIRHHVLDEAKVRLEQTRNIMEGKAYESRGLKEGTFTTLVDMALGECVMSDTWMEIHTNLPFVRQAHGDVFIGGLGLGMIIKAIEDNPQVRSITVLEKHAEIITLITSQLTFAPKVTILEADVMSYRPTQKYDVIYFDIWNHIVGDNYLEMKRLHRRYARSLNRENPNAWMYSWRRADCQRLYREGVTKESEYQQMGEVLSEKVLKFQEMVRDGSWEKLKEQVQKEINQNNGTTL